MRNQRRGKYQKWLSDRPIGPDNAALDHEGGARHEATSDRAPASPPR